MKISIIVPVYNAEPFLRECLDSIVNQEFRSFQLILIDDGSNDKSGSICDEYARLDSRIVVKHTPNRGVSSARNYGLNLAEGDYVWFVDADDVVSSSLLFKVFNEQDLVEPFDNLQFLIFKFDTDFLPNFKTFEKQNLVKLSLGYGTNVSLVSNIFNRKTIVDNEIKFYEDLRFGEDLMFTIEYILHAKCIYAYNQIGYFYRQHQESVMHKNRSLSDALQHLLILERLVDLYPKSDDEAAKAFIIKRIKSMAATLIAFCALSKSYISISDIQREFNAFYDACKGTNKVIVKSIFRLSVMRVSIWPYYVLFKLLILLNYYPKK